MIKSINKKDESLNDLNLLKIREITYGQYEQNYKSSLEKDQEVMIKKNMLSRDSLATTSNLYRALPVGQRKNLKKNWTRGAVQRLHQIDK